ncbi:histidinol dehydrogenase [Laceyella putida]|uniref:Histidinol dehydrogenase n=1 Tax=Laceyella putida TaxID=110101 RepID=A0ABW2RG83_9BACL
MDIVGKETLVRKRERVGFSSEEMETVRGIIARVKEERDQALLALTKQFDRAELSALLVSEAELAQAEREVDPKLLEALRQAAERIRRYHEKQRTQSWISEEADGTILGQRVQPLERVGVYVPGGRAVYPSTVLMNVIPAVVAGVEEVVMVTPPRADGSVPAPTLVAALVAGVNKIVKVGGAQAVAALAYGTESVPKVDKIVGPGNRFVALAKQLVFGEVDIDSIAGPSEIVVIADETADPAFVAADLLSQAEHGDDSSSILITTSADLAREVQAEVERQCGRLERREIARAALAQYGAITVVDHLREAAEVSNRLAPEHLELMVADPWQLLGHIRHAGAIFLGAYSSEPIGDYVAGPNHVLPTAGTARFFSPLGVDHFVKKSSLIYYSKEAFLRDGPKVITLAESEGLGAHAAAIQVRLDREEACADD